MTSAYMGGACRRRRYPQGAACSQKVHPLRTKMEVSSMPVYKQCRPGRRVYGGLSKEAKASPLSEN